MSNVVQILSNMFISLTLRGFNKISLSSIIIILASTVGMTADALPIQNTYTITSTMEILKPINIKAMNNEAHFCSWQYPKSPCSCREA